MKRKLYLEGEIGDKYGRELDVDVSSFQEAFKLLEANYPDLRNYLIDCHERGIGFALETEGKPLEEEQDFILPAGEGDMTIVAVPAGSKSGGAKILAAVLIVAFMWWNPMGWGAAAGGTNAGAIFAEGAALTAGQAVAVNAAIGLAINLALQGIQQLMAPDPATDSTSPQAYLFNGSEQNIIEGDPIPILYGELRVPGRPISFGIVNESALANFNTGWNSQGIISIYEDATYTGGGTGGMGFHPEEYD